MKIRLYPKISYKTCIDDMKTMIGTNKSNLIITPKYYQELHCDYGIFNSYNNNIYCLPTFTTLQPFEVVSTKIKVECDVICLTNSATKLTPMYHIPIDNICYERIDYCVSLSKQSLTKCRFIFNNYGKLEDCYIELEIPDTDGKKSQEDYIKGCLSRDGENSIYGEDVYTLLSLLVNVL